MLILLGYGIVLAFIQKPDLLGELSHISIRFRFPELTFARMSWQDLLAGFVILGLPQAPLTLGNAIIGTVAENNQYFPDRKVTAKTISIDHGVMNLISTFMGGIPMCHGAGGMAGHIRFGARTGGALVILGCDRALYRAFFKRFRVTYFSGLSTLDPRRDPLFRRSGTGAGC